MGTVIGSLLSSGNTTVAASTTMTAWTVTFNSTATLAGVNYVLQVTYEDNSTPPLKEGADTKRVLSK